MILWYISTFFQWKGLGKIIFMFYLHPEFSSSKTYFPLKGTRRPWKTGRPLAWGVKCKHRVSPEHLVPGSKDTLKDSHTFLSSPWGAAPVGRVPRSDTGPQLSFRWTPFSKLQPNTWTTSFLGSRECKLPAVSPSTPVFFTSYWWPADMPLNA